MPRKTHSVLRCPLRYCSGHLGGGVLPGSWRILRRLQGRPEVMEVPGKGRLACDTCQGIYEVEQLGEEDAA